MDWKMELCSGEDKKEILDGLLAFNRSQVPEDEKPFADLSRKVVDENGTIVAGILAQFYFSTCVYVEILWVAENCRKERLGSRLLEAVEEDGRKRGATLIHLDTFDFQARGFYEKHGYEVFGVLEDCPEGHTRYYLKKRLQ